MSKAKVVHKKKSRPTKLHLLKVAKADGGEELFKTNAPENVIVDTYFYSNGTLYLSKKNKGENLNIDILAPTVGSSTLKVVWCKKHKGKHK